MPFRPQTLDVGFNAFQTKVVPVAKPTRVTTLESIGAMFQGDGETLQRATQESVDTIGAGFRMENDVVNAYEYLTQPVFKPDPTFDTAAALKADGLFADYSDNFVGVDNQQEYLVKKAKIAQEQKDRQTLAAAGAGGMIAQMAAGILSPTMLLPFVGELRGMKAVGAGVAMGFAGGALQELPLQANQETRTLADSVSSIAMSTVMGGLLGGAVAFSRKTPQELAKGVLDDVAHDMAVGPRPSAIPQAVGAEARTDPVPEFVRMSPLPKFVDPVWDRHVAPITNAIGDVNIPQAWQNIWFVKGLAGKRLGDLSAPDIFKVNPAYFNLRSQLDQVRRMTAKLEDAGMQIEGAAPGGTVANRVRQYDGPLAESLTRIENLFAQYRFGAQAAGKVGAVARSKVVGLLSTESHLSAAAFRKEIGKAMRNGDQHKIPEVSQAAAHLRKEIYDPLFEAAKSAGLFKNLPDEVIGDATYINRVYDTDLIRMRQPEFEQIIADHLGAKLTTEFRDQAAKLNERSSRTAERVADFSRPLDEVKALRDQFEQELKGLNENRDETLANLEADIADKLSTARTFDSGTPQRASLNDEARSLVAQGGAPLTEIRAKRAAIKRRLTNLRKAESNVTDRQSRKLDKIADAEDASFNTLQSMVRRGQTLIADFDKLSDDVLDARISELKTRFAQTAQRYDNNEERIAKIFADEFENDIPTSSFVQAAHVESAAADKMTDLAKRIDDAEGFSREDARRGVKAMMDIAIENAQKIVERRAVRTQRLREQAQALDPVEAGKRIEALKADGRSREAAFLEQWRERGADTLDPVTGAADFGRYSKEIAHDITESIKGSFMRLPGMDIILKDKGPEMARALDVASEKFTSQDGRSFLVDDAQELMLRYVRTLAPDIELQRAFGDFAPDKGKNVEFIRIREEAVQRIENDLAAMKDQRNPDSGKKVSRPYTQEQMDKRVNGIQAETDQAVKNLEAMISRVRHTWGLPTDPAGMGARMASTASNVNVLRFMSNVLPSSLADVGRPIQKHGLLRVMKDGYVPFVKGLANGTLLRDSLTTRHLRATGAALDVALHSRSSQLFDIGDYVVKGSRFEKAVEHGASKIGVVALFDYWTAAMKQISGSVSHARMMDSLAVVAGGEKASAKELEEATRYLAQGGVNDQYASAIWKQVTRPGGGENVNGQWWPNTETWDRDIRSAYNSFIYRDVSNSIITPGVDAPLFLNSSPIARLVFQFKSFGMAATTRILLSGLQQRDMAFATGTMISLAMGALSYYTYANIVGGAVLSKLQADVAAGDYGTFADEAINRSGILGFGNDIQSIAMGIPGINQHISFGNGRVTRQGYSNLAETVLGPTFGDLLNTGVTIATGASDPTKATLHQARTLLPLQNHALFRHIYDMIEAAAPLKERRN